MNYEFCKRADFMDWNFVKGPISWIGILRRGRFHGLEFCEEADLIDWNFVKGPI